MPRGYRLLFVTIAGLVLSGAQPPKEHVRGKNRVQSAEQGPAPYVPYSGYNPDPCYHAKNHDTADLCAQWRSAIAAERAAHEAERSGNLSVVATFLSAIALFGLLWTIRQGQKGLKRATEANEIARLGLRPFLFLRPIAVHTDGRRVTGSELVPHPSHHGIDFGFRIEIANHGKSPAIVRDFFADSYFVRSPQDEARIGQRPDGTAWPDLEARKEVLNDRVIAAEDPIESEPKTQHFQFQDSFDSMRARRSHMPLIVFAEVSYEDVAGHRWRRKHRWKFLFAGSHFVEDGGADHNGEDEIA